jgi:putative ABC transport system permease protein
VSASSFLARRNLAANRVRFVVSIGGVALALTLVLALDAIFLGVSNQLSRYIDDSGADVWVAQNGVRNLHMVASALPASVVDEVRRVPGVEEATPILYVTGTVTAGDEDAVAYVIGLPDDAAIGPPRKMAAGERRPGPDEAVIDRRAAERLGVDIGDEVAILGRPFRVAGLSEGTSNLVNSIAFVTFDDFAAARSLPGVVSYVLVRVTNGSRPGEVADAIAAAVTGTTAMPRDAFAAEERRLVMDMSGDVIAIMNAIGFAVGLVVVALTVYVATLARRREYGVLKALGASNRFLYRVVLGQASFSVAAGLLVGVGFTAGLAIVVPRTGFDLELAIGIQSVAKVGAVAAVIAMLAALLPIRQIAGLDPAAVFRRGGP